MFERGALVGRRGIRLECEVVRRCWFGGRGMKVRFWGGRGVVCALDGRMRVAEVF